MRLEENRINAKTTVKELNIFVLKMNKQSKSAFREVLEKSQSCGQAALGGEERCDQSMHPAEAVCSPLFYLRSFKGNVVLLVQKVPLAPQGCSSFHGKEEKLLIPGIPDIRRLNQVSITQSMINKGDFFPAEDLRHVQ